MYIIPKINAPVKSEAEKFTNRKGVKIMKTYKEVFTFYEDKDIHKQIQEVEELEIKVSNIYAEIRHYLNDETVDRLDTLIGQLSRAYELQGFAFAQEVNTVKTAEEQAKAEELARQQLALKRKKKTNAEGKCGVPCRNITYAGMTKKIGEWIKYLGCGNGTFYTHYNRGGKDFDNFMEKRLSMIQVGV